MISSARGQNSYTWTGGGGDNNFGTGANWAGGNAPSTLQSYLNFSGNTRLNPFNNYTAYSGGYQIYFNSGAGAYTLSGNGIKFYGYGGGGGNYPGQPNIENDSANVQTVNLAFGVGFGQSVNMNLYANTGDLVFGSSTGNNFSYFDDSGVFLAVHANAGRSVTFWGAIGNGGAAAKFSLDGGGTAVFNAANTYTGETDINSGTLQVNVAPTATSSVYYVGNGGTTGSAAALYLGGGSSGGLNFSNAITENFGSASNRIIGGANTGGTDTYSGTVTITDSNANFRATTGGITAFQTVTSSGPNSVAIGGGGYNGTVSFTGTADNLNIGATVNSGTLLLAKTSSSGVHSIGTNLTVNSGGTVILGGSGGDQLYNTATMTLNGGTFKTAGLSEGTHSNVGVGALTLMTSSTIDLGSGSSILHFADSSSASWTSNIKLSITNWSGSPSGSGPDQILFGSNSGGLTSAQIAEIQFVNPDGYAAGTYGATILSSGELVPVPEPSTWIAAALALGAAALSYRRRSASRILTLS